MLDSKFSIKENYKKIENTLRIFREMRTSLIDDFININEEFNTSGVVPESSIKLYKIFIDYEDDMLLMSKEREQHFAIWIYKHEALINEKEKNDIFIEAINRLIEFHNLLYNSKVAISTLSYKIYSNNEIYHGEGSKLSEYDKLKSDYKIAKMTQLYKRQKRNLQGEKK